MLLRGDLLFLRRQRNTKTEPKAVYRSRCFKTGMPVQSTKYKKNKKN